MTRVLMPLLIPAADTPVFVGVKEARNMRAFQNPDGSGIRLVIPTDMYYSGADGTITVTGSGWVKTPTTIGVQYDFGGESVEERREKWVAEAVSEHDPRMIAEALAKLLYPA